MRGRWVFRKRFGSDPESAQQIEEAFGGKMLRTLTRPMQGQTDPVFRPGKTAWEHRKRVR